MVSILEKLKQLQAHPRLPNLELFRELIARSGIDKGFICQEFTGSGSLCGVCKAYYTSTEVNLFIDE